MVIAFADLEHKISFIKQFNSITWTITWFQLGQTRMKLDTLLRIEGM